MAAKKGTIYIDAPAGVDVKINNSVQPEKPKVNPQQNKPDPTGGASGGGQPGGGVLNNNSEIDDRGKMQDLLTRTKNKLLEISSVFPFDFFPNKIILDERTLTLVYANFFFSKNIITIFIEDVKTVTVDTSFFFSALKFELNGYKDNPQPISNLWTADALKAKRIIIGAQIAIKDKVDLTKFSRQEIASKLEELGKTTEMDTASQSA